MDIRRSTKVMLAIITISTPLALAAETFLRKLMFPPEFEEVRMYFRASLEWPTWSLLSLVLLTTVLGMRAMERRIERRMAKRPAAEQIQRHRHLVAGLVFVATSSSLDARSTMAMEGATVKVVSWYDNEWGYSCRTADLVAKFGAL